MMKALDMPTDTFWRFSRYNNFSVYVKNVK